MKKGFTLVELLAVIVILAVIALITIPAVMKMIDNATTNSYRRSIDLYGGAVNNAIIEYQTDMVEKGQTTNVTFDNIEPYIEYEGNEVDCKLKQIYSDKTILLTECYVEEELVYAEKNRGYGDENYYYYTNSKKKMKVIEYIKAVEEELKDKNITGTCTISEDKITCNGEDINVKSNLENAISGTLVIENNKVVSYSNLKFATEKKTETNNEVPEVIDEEITTGDNNQNNNTQENIATGEDYKGYYADVDGDGTVDGVIYADLNIEILETEWGNSDGTYSYEKGNNFKEYTLSKEKFTAGNFGEKEILSVKTGSSGNSRFYVMSLEDFTTGEYTDPNNSNNNYPAYTSYFWYKNAEGKMSLSDTSTEFGKGYINTGKIIEIWNKNGEGEGSYIEAPQDNRDIWKHIQEKYKKGWFIPSSGEWTAFGDCFTTKINSTTKLTTRNYNEEFGLSSWYWSSSQLDREFSWLVYFASGIHREYVSHNYSVRLSTTF